MRGGGLKQPPIYEFKGQDEKGAFGESPKPKKGQRQKFYPVKVKLL